MHMIRPISWQEIPAAMDMVWDIFYHDHRAACDAGQGQGVRGYLRPNGIRYHMNNGFMRVFGYYDPELVGVLLIEGSHHVGLLYVRRDRQGQGLGRRLLAYAEELAAAAGDAVVTLNASQKGYDFYRHVGYVANGPLRHYDPDITVTPMIKYLKQNV